MEFQAYVTGDAVYGYTEDTAQLIINTSGRMVTGPQRSMGYSQAEAVTCSGSGITQAYIGSVNTFTVNARNAGKIIHIRRISPLELVAALYNIQSRRSMLIKKPDLRSSSRDLEISAMANRSKQFIHNLTHFL